MAKHPNDDLFEGTTMTFGEHLEELRGALFKSLIGLAIGVALGFMAASYVVEFIKSPLETALKKYYETHERKKALTDYGNDVEPELLTMIAKEGLIPAKIEVDPFQLVEDLQSNYPAQFGALNFKPHQFILADISPENAPKLAAALTKAGDGEKETAAKRIWQLLSTANQQKIREIAESGTADPAQHVALVEALNQVIEQPELNSSGPLAADQPERKRIDNSLESHTENTVTQLQASLATTPDPNQSRRLNRFLVVGAFPSLIRQPRMNVVSLRVWEPAKVKVIALGVHEAFMIWVKAAIVTGVVIASPWMFWQIWLFVAAGLYPHEQRYVYVFLPFSMILFLAGAALAFFFVFGYVLDFLFGFNSLLNVDPDPRISEWLSFVLMLPIGFGVSFQLPLVMLFLQRIGIFTVEAYLDKWRIAILVIAVVSMLLTPADPMSMLLMAAPLTGLYFLGIGLCKWMPKSRSPFDEPEDP